MKKIFSFALVAVMAISANATQTMKAEKIKPTINHHHLQMTEVQKQAYALKGEKIQHVVAAGATDTLYYGRPNYAWNWGFTPEFGAYNFAAISISTQDTLRFIKDSKTVHTTAQFGWFVNGQDLQNYSNELIYALPNQLQEGGQYYMPLLADENSNQYMYGESEDEQFIIAGNAWDGMQPFTKCAMYTSTVAENSGWDCYSMAWDNAGNYFMGTGMDMTSQGLGLIDNFVTYFGTPHEAMSVDTISLFVYSSQANPIGPDGLTLIVTQDFENAIAGYKAMNANLVDWSQSQTGTYIGLLNFPVKFTVQGEFAVLLSGFNGQNTKIGCMTDVENWYTFSGDIDPTYFITSNGQLYSFGNNIALSFNACFGNAPQGIENNEAGVKATKAVVDGKIVINKGGKQYNVLGAQF